MAHDSLPPEIWLAAESVVFCLHQTFEVGVPFYRYGNGGSGGHPSLQSSLGWSSTWTPTSSCFVLGGQHLSPNCLSPFLQFLLRVRERLESMILWSLWYWGSKRTRLKKKVINLITKAGSLLLLKPHGRDSLIARRAWEGTWGLLYFCVRGILQPAWCWHQLASCLNCLLKSRRNIKACKLVPAISSKNFSWSWEVIGASLGLIKIDS